MYANTNILQWCQDNNNTDTSKLLLDIHKKNQTNSNPIATTPNNASSSFV